MTGSSPSLAAGFGSFTGAAPGPTVRWARKTVNLFAVPTATVVGSSDFKQAWFLSLFDILPDLAGRSPSLGPCQASLPRTVGLFEQSPRQRANSLHQASSVSL